MKLDLDYIKNLLNIINDNEADDRVSLEYIAAELGIDLGNEENIQVAKKLRKHLDLLIGAKALITDCDGGIEDTPDGSISCNVSVRYRFTMEGHQLLETLNNDTLSQKIIDGLKNIGVETLKQIPALAVEYLKRMS